MPVDYEIRTSPALYCAIIAPVLTEIAKLIDAPGSSALVLFNTDYYPSPAAPVKYASPARNTRERLEKKEREYE